MTAYLFFENHSSFDQHQISFNQHQQFQQILHLISKYILSENLLKNDVHKKKKLLRNVSEFSNNSSAKDSDQRNLGETVVHNKIE